MIPIQDLPELEIQRKLFSFFNDPSKKFLTTSGISVQILSLGSLNRESGPDFLNAALLSNNMIVIGDIEFDKKSSNWYHHEHHFNPEFSNVVLQIVFRNDKDLHIPQLVIDPNEIISKRENIKYDMEVIEDIQSFALKRLLRKSSECRAIIQDKGINRGFYKICKDFFVRVSEKIKRPYKRKFFNEILDALENSEIQQFLNKLDSGFDSGLSFYINELSKRRIGAEGRGIRREVILNCLIPSAIAIANEKQRAELLRWYWSEPASTSYSLIKRRFPSIPQNYLWQQQGVLEYLNNFEIRMVKEKSFTYSISEILEFFDSIKQKHNG